MSHQEIWTSTNQFRKVEPVEPRITFSLIQSITDDKLKCLSKTSPEQPVFTFLMGIQNERFRDVIEQL